MTIQSKLLVELIAATDFRLPTDIQWQTDADGSEALIEFAGRACYETFDKPNPRTQVNASYIQQLMEVGHLALLEHASATMYLRGVSRLAAHEFMQHRHFSFSQLSQRFVSHDNQPVVIPELINGDEQLKRLFLRAVDESRFVYNELLTSLDEHLAAETNALLRKKQIYQAARAILPMAMESRMVVTGNFRTWRHFISMRATEHTEIEIRRIAVECLKILQKQAPAVFDDFEITQLADGSEMALSPYAIDF